MSGQLEQWEEQLRNYRPPTMEDKIVEMLAGFINPNTFDDDVATVLRVLKETDWEPLIRESSARRHERIRKQVEDLNNQMVSCMRCNKPARMGDLLPLDSDLLEALGQFGYSGYCAECVAVIRQEHERTCASCGVVLFVNNTGTLRPLCAKCKGMPFILNEEKRVQSNRMRAVMAGLPATLTLSEWLATINHFNGLCAYCQAVSMEDMEHFIPVQRGGGTTVNNCVPACSSCNTRKNKRNPDDAMLLRFFPNGEIERVRLYLAGC